MESTGVLLMVFRQTEYSESLGGGRAFVHFVRVWCDMRCEFVE